MQKIITKEVAAGNSPKRKVRAAFYFLKNKMLVDWKIIDLETTEFDETVFIHSTITPER